MRDMIEFNISLLYRDLHHHRRRLRHPDAADRAAASPGCPGGWRCSDERASRPLRRARPEGPVRHRIIAVGRRAASCWRCCFVVIRALANPENNQLTAGKWLPFLDRRDLDGLPDPRA